MLNADIFGDPQKAVAAAPYIARRLDALSDETERGWQGEFTEGEGFKFERTRARRQGSRRASTRRCSAPPTRASSTNSRRSLQKIFPRPTPPALLKRKDEETPIHGPSACSRR